jgi:Protein of unknown function (DUF2934)
MNAEKQRRIEQRAYALWLEEGQLNGKDEEHWHRAKQEIEAEESASLPEKPAARRNSGARRANSRATSPRGRKRARA